MKIEHCLEVEYLRSLRGVEVSCQAFCLQSLYSKIGQLKDLQPSVNNNYLFSSLVSHALEPSIISTLSEFQITNLQRVCGLAEYELEKHWSLKIISSKNPQESMEKFPYYQNYRQLTRLEWAAVNGVLNPNNLQRWLFVGGGPLPLTAIILAQEFDIKVKILDFNKEAIDHSRKITKSLELEDIVEVEESRGEDFLNYFDHQIIFVAALAGLGKNDKQNIFKRIAERGNKGSLVLARSSYGNRRILYPELDLFLYRGFEPLFEMRPYNNVVNSAVVFQYLG